MICKKIIYRNFRNIEYAVLEPSDAVTVLNGSNGQGKTNALEGINIFAQGRSFRTSHERELIRFGEDIAEITLQYIGSGREAELKIMWCASREKRYCKKNGVNLPRMSEMMGSFRAVMFCPEHLSLIKDGPAVRRQFTDVALSQTDNVYLSSLQRYNAILAQRNALIKSCRENRSEDVFNETAKIWSAQLAKESALISSKRAEYIEKLDCVVKEIVSEMTSGKENARLAYMYPRTEKEYFRLLTENTERELKYGSTLYGAHKDDIGIYISDRDARSFASQGQQRSIALAMKLGEGELSRKASGEYPVFLFDDILSELDDKRRSYLMNGISGRQVIITSCDRINTGAKIYRVDNGKIFG